MSKQQSGFTLIELIAVIVILGILAATAVPRFLNLQDEAEEAALNGVAGSLESSSALNAAVDMAVEAGLTTTTTDPFENIDDCSDGGDLLTGGLPADYSLSSGAITDQQATDCTLTGPDSSTTTVSIIGACGSDSDSGDACTP